MLSEPVSLSFILTTAGVIVVLSFIAVGVLKMMIKSKDKS